MFYQFRAPFSMIISGPSGCGKSTFLQNLIKNRNYLIDTPIKKIIWCYAEENALPQSESKIEFFKGVPESIENSTNEPLLVILDDLMMDGYGKTVCELFTKGSHHRNISVILVTQNVFHKTSLSRDISLNAKYIIVFKNPRDKQQFTHLARQIFPENSSELVRVYKEITQRPHGYLLIDLTQNVNDSLRFRTNIFNRNYITVYSNLCENGLQTTTFNGQQAYIVCP